MYQHGAIPLLGLIVLAIPWWVINMSAAVAQTPANCQPPKTGEYLVLVRSPTSETQEKLRRTLPPNTNSIVCRYLNETVTRTGSFTQLENANSQAQLVRSAGLSAFVLRSPGENSPQAAALADTPQPLGAGYAVLVEYFNRPETVTQVQEVLGSDVGLTSYAQRTYLLALHTSDQNQATATLKKLSDRGFYALLVDSRQVTLLRP